jgi:hypothetical protein
MVGRTSLAAPYISHGAGGPDADSSRKIARLAVGNRDSELRASVIERRRAEPGWRAAVLDE